MLKNVEVNKEVNKLQNEIVFHVISKAIILATKGKLSDHLAHGPIKSDELAERLGYHPQAAKRLFRLLESLDLLKITDELITSTELTSCIDQIHSEH